MRLTESSGLSKKENNERSHEGGRGLLRKIQRKLEGEVGAGIIILYVLLYTYMKS